MIATEGSQRRKQQGHLNRWSLCWSIMVLKIRGQASCIKLSITFKAIREPDQLTNACAGLHRRKCQKT
jgi:hypothetical protein